MARNRDTERFKKSALHGCDFPIGRSEQKTFVAPTDHGQLSKCTWVCKWDKNVGADMALEYINREVHCSEV